MEDQTDTFIQSQFILLGLQFHVDEGKLTPFCTANQRNAVLRRSLATIKQPLLHVEDSARPQLLTDWIAKLEILQILYVDDVFALYLPTWVLVGPQLIFLVDVKHGFLGRPVHSVKIAFKTVAQLLVGLFQALTLFPQQGEGIECDKCYFFA